MRLLPLFTMICLWGAPLWAELSVSVHYVRQVVPPPPTLSDLDPPPEELGRDGARLGLADNLTTGRFLKHDYALSFHEATSQDGFVQAASAALAQSPFVVLDAPMASVLAVADLAQAQQAVLFNIAAPDGALRDGDCRANLLHTLPSTRMRTDALAQYLLSRQWRKLALIDGPHPQDQEFAAALQASLTKFGLTLAAHKTWSERADLGRTASSEMPLFTQSLGEYDVLLVADEVQDFGRYIAFNTWLPRPLAGSEGLMPVTWAPVIEQWGAAQLQSRFTDLAARPMAARDYAGWAALRALGEAVTRTNATDPATLRAYLLSDGFELAGFKGRALSFRPWNGQLRQPIALVTDRAQVAAAPIEGFLHQTSELDTLGLDRPESACRAFAP